MIKLMIRLVPVIWIFLLLGLSGCPKREQPPESAYDPELLEAARAAAKDRENDELDANQDTQLPEGPAECTRESGGCKKGYICWDSHFCKQGFSDQCSASGDKRCHKECAENKHCPNEMPYCVEKPIFSGSERGKTEKFCVEEK